MITRKLECRKFVPNIFDKRKCSNCFRQREEHNAEALSEFNQMSRKILKCGYLFVAPDWDFTNPLYRSKRWQRRWFVLFDDGELSYSLDDHIDTVPQGIVDVTKVVDISSAESTTGHPFSLCISETDRRTFVKGTFPDETKWWFNELRNFMKTSKDRIRKDAYFREKRTPMYFQASSGPNSYGGSSGDVVDFGSFTPQSETESCDTGSKSLECANNNVNNEKDLNLINNNSSSSTFSRRTKAANRSLTLPIYANITPRHSTINDDGNSSELMGPQTPQERGDPDGDCGVDKISTCMTRSSEYIHDEMIKLKKGWLYKKDTCAVWTKHWFSQNGAALFYYRDAIAEERGILDGVLDLNNVTDIKIDNSIENKFSFVMTTWDNRKITLAALTNNARSNWITIIKVAIGKDDIDMKPVKTEESLPALPPKTESNKEVAPVLKEPPMMQVLKQTKTHRTSAKQSSAVESPQKYTKTIESHTEQQLRRMGSVSDLADLPEINPYSIEQHVLAKEYTELKYRFQKIIEELRILKKELKDAYYIYDTLEIDYKALKLEMDKFRVEEQTRIAMMAERIEDLTNKYTSAEKNARNWKMKLSRAERRRSVSLKGRECAMKEQQPDSDHGEIVFRDDVQLIENKLTYRLCSLLNERQLLLEKNELTCQRKKELLIQRLAYESVCFESLKSSMQPKRFNFLKDLSILGEMEAKIADLSRKVNNEVASNQQKSSDTLTYAPVKLAMFDILYLVSQKKNHSSVLEKLLSLQKGLIALVEKYKKQKIECLLYSLAVENKNSREDVLQNIINEITNCAMKKTNEDLVKYEIDHMMALLSRSCDTLLKSPLPLTMFSTDMYYFESFVDKIYHSLKRELAVWVSELNNCFDKVLLKIKEGQWCFQLEQERNAEKKFLLSDLSNVIVLKSVIDGQILFMTSDLSSDVPFVHDRNEFFTFLEELKDQYQYLETSFDPTNKNCESETVALKHAKSEADEMSFSRDAEKTLQKRYCEEIEQLRTLCQRGMDAMRASHNAIVTEMEENHRKQIQQLMVEKEQALAEETKATLAALDAMQKAHKNEVQREILRFKNEFIRQSQQFTDSDSQTKEQKKTELEEIRQEIWSLSEKYTNKCLQVASLEEKLHEAQDNTLELKSIIRKLEIK
ncbi:protein outspread-like [Culicoides brevitarsis]|uniref:protein outspread-like n=1 Tax=Culicoides brevitarsis TaxID=469753 RepID=UPI00307CC04B